MLAHVFQKCEHEQMDTSNLEQQIKDQMKKSFADLIQSTFSKSSLDEKDIEWIGSLCVELKTRINGLTPSRGDLHADLETKFDIELLKQMLRHNACEIDDVRPLVSTLQSRISMLCAPVQDQEVKKYLTKCRRRTTWVV